jgi:hypothetical protein
MSYTINRYNGNQITVIADGTIDATLDLKLIGKNYAGYGSIQNENFVYLLENFANTTQPPKPLPGQIWFDTGHSKLKFYDGTKFRTTGGAEIGGTAPTGLTQGDFWYDTINNQLYAWNGTTFTLIGPQGVAGAGTTQMRSISLKDSFGVSHPVIQGVDNGQVIFTISADSDFILDNTQNAITGFTTIHQGITLVYTNNNAAPGVTNSPHRFWGTATNADQLGGLPVSAFVQTGSASFSTAVNFADVGYTVGNPVARLVVFNQSATTPTIRNQSNSTIVFQTTVSAVTKTPLQLVGTDMLPGTTLTNNIGSPSFQWNQIYASYVNSTSAQADALNVGGTYRTASVASSPNTIVARDGSSNISANLFQGIATSANYADLAEKYLTDVELEPGTVVTVGGTAEVTTATFGSRAIGVISTNPAYMMNSELVGGTYVALKGRVPCKVIGPISKGDRLLPYGKGRAISAQQAGGDVFAIALEDFSSDIGEEGVIEVVVL